MPLAAGGAGLVTCGNVGCYHCSVTPVRELAVRWCTERLSPFAGRAARWLRAVWPSQQDVPSVSVPAADEQPAVTVPASDGPSAVPGHVLESAPASVAARPRRRPPAAVMRRPAVVLSLGELHGPAAGVVEPPRSIWWSGAPQVDLGDFGQAVVFYDQLLDQGSREEIAAWADADLLARLWPTMGGRRAVREGWEAVNPELGAATAQAPVAA
jgi:hypothetical protein